MANPLNLAQGAAGQPRPQLINGIVSTAKPAPVAFTSPLYVTIPQWRPDYFYELTIWPQLHGSTLPVQGATVLLAYDDQRQLWCLSWHN